jgi:hypothetical protein
MDIVPVFNVTLWQCKKISERYRKRNFTKMCSATTPRLATKLIKEFCMTPGFPKQDRKELQVANNLLENPGIAF